jgi:hypothetical protein
LKPDPLAENIYQAVCAKKCPTILPADAKIVDGKAVIQFEIMATTNYTDGIATLPEAGVSNFNIEVTNPDDMINLVIMNSTSKYNTCMPNAAADYAE